MSFKAPAFALAVCISLLSLLCIHAWPTRAQNPDTQSLPAPISPAASLTQISMSGEPGDYIGGPTNYSYTPTTGTFSASAGDNNGDGKPDAIQISYSDNVHWWYLNFNTYHVTGQNLVPGFYDNAQRAPFAASGHPGIDIFGDGRGCNTITGNFTVHEANFDTSSSPAKVLNFTASFEQHCEGGTAALLGTVYYNYTGAAEVRYAISGNIADNFGKPVANLPIVLSGSQIVNGTTDSSGNYFFDQLLGSGEFRLTPNAGNGYVMSPTTQSVKHLLANATANFTAVALYTLSGQIVNGSGVPITGVSVALSGSQTANASTDNNGSYSFANLRADGNFTVTPTRTNYGFTPAKAVFNTLTGNTTANFTGNLNTYTLAGRLIDTNGIGISQATLSLSGTQASTTQTDANGNYSFSNLMATGNYTVTPSKINYSFAPTSVSFSNLSTNLSSVNFTGTLKTYIISGVVLDGNGNGVPSLVFTLSGSQSGTNATDTNGVYSFTVIAGGNYTVTPATTAYTFTPSSRTFNNISANQTGNFVAAARIIQFSGTAYGASEGSGTCSLNVVRSGDTSAAATVAFATSNDTAKEGKDYVSAAGILNFAAGEISKTITVLIIDNAFLDGSRTLNVTLSNPTGALVGSQNTIQVTITDNDTTAGPNPVDTPRYFVQFNYYDFLARYPDASGWDFWTNQITSCGTNPSCTDVARINTSGAFFLSIEFQQTGYLVERMYKTAYSDATGNSTFGGAHQLPVPVVRFSEFLRDTQRIGQGVIVLQTGWEQQLENNKQAYAGEFVLTNRFLSAFPMTMTPASFVDKLNQNAGSVLSASERTTAISLFGGAPDSSNTTARAQAVRQIAEDADLVSAEKNSAFVLAQYFGYLRRDPNSAPDTDYTGYDFWLAKLNQFNGDYIAAEMVKAFISSSEYRQRFGP